MSLSKSQYIRGLQCQKSLWLNKHHPELKTVSKQSENLFEAGYQVGDIAKKLFPNGIEIKFNRADFNGMVIKTRELIENGTEVIYEACFKEDGIFVMADILVRNGSMWDMYEVKASTGVKSYYIDDIAIQWHVANRVIKLNRTYVVHLNNKYVKNGEHKIKELFSRVDVTDKILKKQETVKVNLTLFEDILSGDIPEIDIGTYCTSPHTCDFKSHCWQHIPKQQSVFQLAHDKKIGWKLYEKGILSIDDIPDDTKLKKKPLEQVKYHRSQEIKVEKDKIKIFLKTIKYPINFFDFETFSEAIPRFDNQKPFAKMQFQYSLHILHENGTLEHKEFLGDENNDPRRALSEQMLRDITEDGSIIAYHQSFEISQIKDLAGSFEDISSELLSLNDRFIDIEIPFSKRNYYHPNFNGKSSIKIVLPTLFPNDDELDYKKLGSIQNGVDAMNIFAKLHLLKDKNKLDEIRKDLLAYCRLDTLAMVRIWEKLHKIVDTKNI